MCIFCEIVKGNIPSYKVYEDDKCMAFLDISQTTLGHTLVIPKEHFENIFELNDDTSAHIFKVVKNLSLKISKALGVKDLNVLNNNGTLAGQTVKHFHIHIIPAYENSRLDIKFAENKLEKEEFISIMEKIKRA